MAVIKDKVVVITGASSGIGEATAVMLAKRGGKVVFGVRAGWIGWRLWLAVEHGRVGL